MVDVTQLELIRYMREGKEEGESELHVINENEVNRLLCALA